MCIGTCANIGSLRWFGLHLHVLRWRECVCMSLRGHPLIPKP